MGCRLPPAAGSPQVDRRGAHAREIGWAGRKIVVGSQSTQPPLPNALLCRRVHGTVTTGLVSILWVAVGIVLLVFLANINQSGNQSSSDRAPAVPGSHEQPTSGSKNSAPILEPPILKPDKSSAVPRAPVSPNEKPAPSPAPRTHTSQQDLAPAKVQRPTEREEAAARSLLDVAKNCELNRRSDLAVAKYKEILLKYPGTDGAKNAEYRLQALSGK